MSEMPPMRAGLIQQIAADFEPASGMGAMRGPGVLWDTEDSERDEGGEFFGGGIAPIPKRPPVAEFPFQAAARQP